MNINVGSHSPNRYPWLPIADGGAISVRPKISQLVLTNGTDWGLNGDTYESSLKAGGDDITFTFSEDINVDTTDLSDENTASPLNDLEWISDDQYPAEYITQLKEWADKAGTVPDPTPRPEPALLAGPQVFQQCNGLGSKKYVAQPQLADNIKDFCSQAVKQGVQDKDSGSISRSFNQKVGQDQNLHARCVVATILTSFYRRSTKSIFL